jgi:predicted ATP-dependent serine protease
MNGVIIMIRVLAGEKGTGKTKKMLSLANELLTQSKGHIVYISNNSESMFELNSSIRLVDVSQFPISTIDSFIGFLYGVISEDYDIESIFIDNLSTILNEDGDGIQRFFDIAREVAHKYNITLYVSMRNNTIEMVENEVEYIAV